MKTAMNATTATARPAMKRTLGILIALASFWSLPVLAQQSASYRLEEHVLNAGGRPLDGTILASASFRMSLDAIADGVVATGLSSASFGMDGGFTVAYPPPGEVIGLRFAATQSLVWDPEKSVGTYNLYRAQLTDLPGLLFGSCFQQGLSAETTTDMNVPGVGSGFFYLVTAENSLAEEGTKGFQTNGIERQGSACP